MSTGQSQPSEAGTSDTQALDLIRASGVLNPNITLDKIMELTQRLSEQEGLRTEAVRGRHVDTFIHSHFIYRHEE
jgi:hypothetical protein